MTEGFVHEGLEGILVTETALSHVDGHAGRLVIAGADVESLAGHASYEAVAARLFSAADPGAPVGGKELASRIAEGRERAYDRLDRIGDALEQENAMDALRAAVAHLPSDSSRDDVLGALAVFTAAFHRIKQGRAPLPPSRARGHAEDLLAMCGLPHDGARAAALETYLVTVIDHGLNASTFAARVVTSTRSDLVSAVVAGLGALKGPLHGGAPGPVLDMLDAIGEPARARAWLEGELAAGRRIMGMGHRIYRVRDPRALVLERGVAALRTSIAAQAGNETSDEAARLLARLTLARAVEEEAGRLLEARHPGRPLRANVEFFTALLLDAVGIDRSMFTAVFAVGRCAGWAAHACEQARRGRLIRPSARYVGAA